MERLTKRIGEHVYYTKLDYSKTIPSEYNPNDIGRILQALCAYEDTEHTPEECAAAFEERDTYKMLRADADRIREGMMQKELMLISDKMRLEKELAAYRAADIWEIVCFMIARNNIIGSAPKEQVDVMALMTIKSMPDMLQMEECRKLLATAEAALKEQEGQKCLK